MAQGYNGSICIDDLFNGKIAKGSNGKHYVCIEDLNDGPFNKGKINGKTYAGINVWINDELDQFNNIAGISLQQTLKQREEKEKRTYIGNLKFMQAQQPAVKSDHLTGLSTEATKAIDDLPF